MKQKILKLFSIAILLVLLFSFLPLPILPIQKVYAADFEVNLTNDIFTVGDADTLEGYQTFSSNVSYNMTSVRFRGYREGAPGTFFVDVWKANSSNVPLVQVGTGSIQGNDLQVSTNISDFTVNLTGSVTILKDEHYAIVHRNPTGNFGLSDLVWIAAQSTNVYPNGTMGSWNGTVFLPQANQDLYFVTTGIALNLPTIVTGTASGSAGNYITLNGALTGLGDFSEAQVLLFYYDTDHGTTLYDYPNLTWAPYYNVAQPKAFSAETNETYPAGTTIYYRAVAGGSGFYVMGDEQYYTVSTPDIPVILSTSSSINNFTSVTFSATITPTSGITSQGFRYGTTNSTLINNVPGTFTSSSYFFGMVSGLTPDTTYYAQAYAKKGSTIEGTSSIWTFTTSSGIPTVSLVSAVVNGRLVTLTGNIDSLGGASEITAYGFIATKTGGQPAFSSYPIGQITLELFGQHRTTTGQFVISDQLLEPGTYFYRATAIATGSVNWGYSTAEGTFTISANLLPFITTVGAQYVSPTSENLTGYQVPITGEPIIARGFDVWRTGYASVNGTQTGNFSGSEEFYFAVTGLTPSTTYNYRAFGISVLGNRGNGETSQFITGEAGSTPTPIAGSSATSGFALTVVNLARYQGLDNSFGHYAFLLETMLLIALIFGILIICIFVKTKEWNTACQIIIWILLIAEIIDILAFVLTGWLGVWPFIILGCIVVAVIIWGIASVVNKGGGG